MKLLFIKWNVNPELFRIAEFPLRYYSLMFVIAFFLGYLLMKRMYLKEGLEVRKLDSLVIYLVLGTLIGARLGHVFFYEFGYYKHHLLEIILPFRTSNNTFEWTGYQGLASHGGAIGVLLAILLYCKKYKQEFLRTVDKVVIVVALAGFLYAREICLTLRSSESQLMCHGLLFSKEWILYLATRRSCMKLWLTWQSFRSFGIYMHTREGN